MTLREEPKFRPGRFRGIMKHLALQGLAQMANETVKVLLMIALFLSIEITFYLPRIQVRWRRILRTVPRRGSAHGPQPDRGQGN